MTAASGAGGGHGLAMPIKAVDTYAGHTTAIVATGDDGGSSGRLRECISMPAPGDLRRCIAAVSPNTELADAMEHRFRARVLLHERPRRGGRARHPPSDR